jgi:hypothetical protein
MQMKCPACKKATTWEHNRWRPFCSERCKLIDLGRWVSEEYAIAGSPAEEQQKEQEGQEPKGHTLSEAYHKED